MLIQNSCKRFGANHITANFKYVIKQKPRTRNKFKSSKVVKEKLRSEYKFLQLTALGSGSADLGSTVKGIARFLEEGKKIPLRKRKIT